jgi:alpha-galactosidase
MRETGLIVAVTLLSLVQRKTFAQQVLIPIETKNNALVLQTDANKQVGIIYMGPKLADKNEYNQVTAMYKQGSDYRW